MQKEFLYFDPHLIDESVFAALQAHPSARQFHAQRARLYELPSIEEREGAFDELHRAWFRRLRLAETIEQALEEQPTLFARTNSCVVRRALDKKQEGAELFVSPVHGQSEKETKTIRLLLRAASLLQPGVLLEFLRYELFHIVDMVNPAFKYEPALPAGEGGPTYDVLLRERYKILWDTAIIGRMVKCGWLPPASCHQQRREFTLAFPMLKEETEEIFDYFFNHELPTHPEFVAFAQDPRKACGATPATPRPGSRCPLCGFPSYSFEPRTQDMGSEIVTAIVYDFPRWDPSHGLCTQCADLYRTNHLSKAAARLLPGDSDFSSNG